MNVQPDIEELKERHLCADCIGEHYLKSMVLKDGIDCNCSYCNNTQKSYPLGRIALLVGKAFEDHFHLTENAPPAYEYALYGNSGLDWERDGTQVVYQIADAVDVSGEIAEDIRIILDEKTLDRDEFEMGVESPFESEAHYEPKWVDDIDFQKRWGALEKGLKSEARFFNTDAKVILDSIFGDINSLYTLNSAPVIINAGPSCAINHLYRARVFHSVKELEKALKRPDREIGTPPTLLAKSGRMNARGISVFYGAIDERTAIAEIRPPVGSFVVAGRFDIVTDLKLLDLEALRSLMVIGSIFDPHYLRRLERAKFIATLSHKMTQPVMPNDEAFEYLITQVIAEYLSGEKKLDGIIYPSSQVSEEHSNVVLFHHASVVEPIQITKGATPLVQTHAHDDDGGLEFTVWETKLSASVSIDESYSLEGDDLHQSSAGAALRIAWHDLKVHEITGVLYSSNPYEVTHYSLPVASTPDNESIEF